MVKEYSLNMVYNLKHLPIRRSWSYFQPTVSFIIQGTGIVVHFSFITIQDVSGKLVYQFSFHVHWAASWCCKNIEDCIDKID